VDAISTGYGTAPLHLAVAKGYREKDADKKSVLNYERLVKKLIEVGADVNLPTGKHLFKQKKGGIETEKLTLIGSQMPLHIAATRRDWEMMELLLNAGAEKTLVNGAGLTPLEIFDLPYEERKQIVDSISGEGLNNFVEYEKKHANADHLEKCKALLDISLKQKPGM